MVLWQVVRLCKGNYHFDFQFSGYQCVVHLWIVHPEVSVESGQHYTVSHFQSLEGHSAPITCLEFSESASLLASGCKAGSVRIWDLKVWIMHTDRVKSCVELRLLLCNLKKCT